MRMLIKYNKKNSKDETTPTIGNDQGKTSLIAEEGDGLLKNR
jgi:hypothetical protein